MKNSFSFFLLFDLFRVHRQDICYQLGYVLNGSLVRTKRASCPNGKLSGGVWFTVRVEVSSDKSVSIYLNNDLLKSLTAHHSTKGRGGVLVQNGYKNIIQFRKFTLNDAR